MMKLATLDQLVAFGEYPDKFSRTLLLMYLEGVSKKIESYCNRSFAQSTDTDYFTTDYNKEFQLERYPVSESDTFSVTMNLYGAYDNQDLGVDFMLNPIWGFISFVDELIPNEPRNLRAYYTGGYTELTKNTTPGTWAALTTYSVNDRILVDDQIYRCTVAGTSDSTIPTFNTTVASNTTDDSVTWTEDSGNDGVLAVPADLRNACLIQTDFEVRHRNTRGTNSVTTPDGTFGLDTRHQFLSEVLDVLKGYRRKPSLR